MDRRAKLVVSEFSEEQSDSQSPGVILSSFGISSVYSAFKDKPFFWILHRKLILFYSHP